VTRLASPYPVVGRQPELKGHQELRKRVTLKLGKDQIIRNLGKLNRRILLGIPTLGVIRVEWDVHRRGQIIPINFQIGEITATHQPPSVISEGYHTADAQNTIVERAVLDGYEWCFRGDTLVETVDGAKPIQDIQIGELVKTHTGQFRRVLKTMQRNLKQRAEMIWVRTAHGVTKTTLRHPFWTRRDGEMCWVAAEELRSGDPVFYPAGQQKEDRLVFDVAYSSNGREKGAKKYGALIDSLAVDRRLARLLGLFLAEGHASPDHFAFTVSNEEVYLQDFIVLACRDFFGREARIIRPGWSTQVRVSIRPIAQRLREWFGHRAKNKHVPEFVFGWNLENRLEFLKGYLDGDGCFYGRGKLAASGKRTGKHCSFSSASQELMNGIAKLARSCGLSVTEVKRIETHAERGSLSSLTGHQIRYDARFPTKSVDKFLNLLESKRGPDLWEMAVTGVERHPLGLAATVYNLEIEEDNSYIADFDAVHNCLLWEDDVLPPFDALMKMNQHMIDQTAPIVSGLYFSKGEPSWPLVFRGRGNGAYLNFKLGDRVWCDGVPTGFLLIHGSILQYMWANSEEYKLPDGRKCRRVFQFPRESWFDPEQDKYFAQMGTSDLHFCDRLMKEKVFAKTGWKKFASMKYPFLCDTSIYAQQIDLQGKYYPAGCTKILAPKRSK
jgi:hypothetical protein